MYNVREVEIKTKPQTIWKIRVSDEEIVRAKLRLPNGRIIR